MRMRRWESTGKMINRKIKRIKKKGKEQEKEEQEKRMFLFLFKGDFKVSGVFFMNSTDVFVFLVLVQGSLGIF